MEEVSGRGLRQAALGPAGPEPVPVSALPGNDQPREICRWRCETCRGELTMPAGFGEWGYFCCYASMSYLGRELAAPTSTDGD
jgi:hypothetical protein